MVVSQRQRISTLRLDPWAEQWARVLRWYALFEKTTVGREQDELTSEHYLDQAYAFFQNCFHLKDWLQHDPASTGAVGDIGGTPVVVAADLGAAGAPQARLG